MFVNSSLFTSVRTEAVFVSMSMLTEATSVLMFQCGVSH